MLLDFGELQAKAEDEYEHGSPPSCAVIFRSGGAADRGLPRVPRTSSGLSWTLMESRMVSHARHHEGGNGRASTGHDPGLRTTSAGAVLLRIEAHSSQSFRWRRYDSMLYSPRNDLCCERCLASPAETSAACCPHVAPVPRTQSEPEAEASDEVEGPSTNKYPCPELVIVGAGA